MADDNLKNLPPQERIKKLKEIEAKKKKEIEDAQKQIRDSEVEIEEVQKFKEKVPIPEAAKEDLEGLSVEGKEILKVLKGKKEAVPKEEGEKKPAKKEEVSLEETLAQEVIKPIAGTHVHYDAREGPHVDLDYVAHLSQAPAERLQHEAQSLYNEFKAKGYMNEDEQRRAVELYGASDLKERAAEGGLYPTFTEEVAQNTSLVKQIAGHLLHNMYQRDKGESHQKDWYKGR